MVLAGGRASIAGRKSFNLIIIFAFVAALVREGGTTGRARSVRHLRHVAGPVLHGEADERSEGAGGQLPAGSTLVVRPGDVRLV